jgi:hypothetical protein
MINSIKFKPLWILFLLVVVTRLAVAWYVYPDVSKLYNGDSSQYEQYALSMLETGEYLAPGYGSSDGDPFADMIRPPGFPVTIYLVYLVFGASSGPWAIIILAILGNFAVLFLLFAFMKLLEIEHLWPMLLFFALDPVWSLYTKDLITEPYFAPMMLLAVFLATIALARLTEAERTLPGLHHFPKISSLQPIVLLAITGMLMGIATLFKPIMLYGPWAGLIILTAGYFLFRYQFNKPPPSKESFYSDDFNNYKFNFDLPDNFEGESNVTAINSYADGAPKGNDHHQTKATFTSAKVSSGSAAFSVQGSIIPELKFTKPKPVARKKKTEFIDSFFEPFPVYTTGYSITCFFVFFMFAQLFIFPWQLRQYIHHQTFTFTSIQAENLMMGHAAFVLAEAESFTHLEAQQEIRSRFVSRHPNHAEYPFSDLSVAKTEVATEILSEHPFIYTKAIIRGMLVTLLDPGRLVVERTFGQQDPNEIGLTNTVAKDGIFRTIQRFVGENPTTSKVLLVYMFILGIFLMMSLFGGITLAQKHPIAALFIIGCFIYMLILGGPIGYARFRMYIMPWMLIMATSGVAYLYSLYQAKTAGE